MVNKFFNWKVLIFAIILFVLNVILILQLIPVFESSSISARIVNLVVSPSNFIFEDLFGINSIKIIDYLTWLLQFFYDYLIAFIILKILSKFL